MEKNKKIVLGLIWILILNFQIETSGENKDSLLAWVNSQIAPFQSTVPQATNFTSSFQDGKVLMGLIESLKTGSADLKSFSDPLKDTETAICLAEKNLNIPALVDAVDVVNCPDEHSMVCATKDLNK
mmetsp:Transcript_8650/g.12892  ORF Transcript_8650/g.12892 Transcript_8650/m.12892 type:complete len:127 (+) Transcript_8650:1-381(+)